MQCWWGPRGHGTSLAWRRIIGGMPTTVQGGEPNPPILLPVLARGSQAASWDSCRTLVAAGQPALSNVHSPQQKFATRNTLGQFLGLNTLQRAYSYVYALYA
jgi:hypothetical protein